jgi:hypothetical protein
MIGNLIVMVVVNGFVGAAIAENAPIPEGAKPKLITRMYDLKPILGEKSPTTKLANADAVVRLILDSTDVGDLKPGSSGPQIVIREEHRLEVLATEKLHGGIKDLLEALVRMADLAIDIKTTVIELEVADFKKRVKPFMESEKGIPNSPVVPFYSEQSPKTPQLKELDKIMKAGKVIQFSESRFANGIKATLSARQSVRSYSLTAGKAHEPKGKAQFVAEGFKLLGLPRVSTDRRFVRMKLTEQSTMFVRMKTRSIEGFGGAGENEIKLLGPEVAELGGTGSVEVEDGGALLFCLAYAPKDKVWVVIVRPTIFIQSEEDALKEEALKKDGKK